MVTVKYQAFVEALTFLRGVLRQPDSIGVLHGPEMAGKSTIVRDLGAALGDAEIADLVAFLNARTGETAETRPMGRPETVPSGLPVAD